MVQLAGTTLRIVEFLGASVIFFMGVGVGWAIARSRDRLQRFDRNFPGLH